MRVNRTILKFLALVILLGCSRKEESSIIDSLNKVDKVFLFKNINNEFCPIMSLDTIESKRFINTIKSNFKKRGHRKIYSDLKFNLFQRDTLIGTIEIENGINQYATFESKSNKFGFKFNRHLGKLIDQYTNSNYLNCSTNIDTTNRKYYDYNNWVHFDSISALDFIKLLPVKNISPENTFVLNTIGQADTSWIRKSDIPKLMKFIDSEQPAYCVMRVISSYLPIKERSTVGGQVMNLIDAYRYKKPYPFFLTNCSKSDQVRKQEILKWWNKNNN